MSKTKRERKGLVNKANSLSVKRQVKWLLEFNLNLHLMRKIDEEHLKKPWLVVPRITEWIRKNVGIQINPKRIERLFKLLEISAIYPKPKTSKRGKGEDFMRTMDITYVPTRGGFLYLNAIIDVYSRYIVGRSLSNTL